MSAIEWTDETWNPTVGCSRVSPGCDGCYAIGVAHRAMQPAHEGLTVRRPGERTDWTGEVRCLPDRLYTPLHWRKPRRVFVDSMSDLFHPDVPAEFIAEVWDTMGSAGEHTFQVLTKRPQRMATTVQRLADGYYTRDDGIIDSHPGAVDAVLDNWPLPNVWLGTSIESDRYTFRADHLRATPAAVRFLSLEPLLGPLPSLDLTGIDWVIVGGESGPGARPMHPDWVRDIRDRCVAASVPFFFKQWGEWTPAAPERGPEKRTIWLDGSTHSSSRIPPTGARPTLVWRVGKKAAGRELDGRTWDQMPACPTCDGAGFYHHSEEQETCEACDGTGDRQGSGAPHRGEGT